MIFTPYSSGSQAGNMSVADDGETQIILDCGVSWTQAWRYLGMDTSRVAGILVSHYHGDHGKGIDKALKAGKDCWMSSETAKALGVEDHHRSHIMLAFETVWVGSWEVQSFKTIHDAPGSFGFILQNKAGERLLYLTDSQYMPYLVHDISIVAVECNYSLELLRESVEAGTIHPVVKRRIMESHFSLENLGKMLIEMDLSRVREVWLLHLSRNNSDAEVFKRTIQETVGCPVYVA